MARIVRLRLPVQPLLPLGHGPVHWDTLPLPIREHVLALWRQMLTEHLGHSGTHPGDALAVAVQVPEEDDQ